MWNYLWFMLACLVKNEKNGRLKLCIWLAYKAAKTITPINFLEGSNNG